MSGFGHRYVVDTNALSQIGKRRRSTSYFKENVQLASEVLHEAQGFPDWDSLNSRLYPTSPRLLSLLTRIMASIPLDDTKLVDLYANRGGADPFVVACALDGAELDSHYLDAPEWVVVTNDAAVRLKAEEFGLRVIASAQFADIIDAVEPGDTAQ